MFRYSITTFDATLLQINHLFCENMNQRISISLLVGIILVILFWVGCGTGCSDSDPCPKFIKAVRNKLPTHLGDTCLTDDDWNKLKGISIPEGIRTCSLLDSNGELNRDSVIAQFTLKPCKKLSYKIYLEASGSMKNYDNKSMSGGLRTCVQNFYDFTGKSHKSLAFVSDKIYDANDVIKEVLDEPGNQLFDQAKIKEVPAGQTLFEKIFGSVIEQLGSSEIALIVSDMCYSRDGEVDATRLAEQAEKAMFKIFDGPKENYDVLLLQFYGDYDGPYYSHKYPLVKAQTWTNPRPYYLVFIAQHTAMEEFLNHQGSLDNWKNYVDNQSKNKYLFKTFSDTLAKYCYLSESSDCTGRLEGAIMTGLKSNNREENTSVYVGVNLAGVYADKAYLKDVDNYDLGDNREFELSETLTAKQFRDIVGVSKLNQEVWNKVNPTHVLKLNMLVSSATNQSELTVQLKQRFPRWVKASTIPDDTDVDAPNFGSKTFALEQMMNGLFKAYYGPNEPTIKTFTIKFKD